ncbi:MAG: DUF488 domain-containing protein [Dehalococcoidia bacterium]
MAIEILTIGFTRTSAERFFARLKEASVVRVLDIRLHNDSQLAAFAKAGDLPYFLRELIGATYEHDVRLAPDESLLTAVRKERLPLDQFHARYRSLMDERDVPGILDRASFERKRTALLCSEPTADRCHRGALAAILAEAWGAAVTHL